MNGPDFANLTTLGKLYGAGPRDVGNWLKDLNLREPDGRPTRKAINEGFVKERLTEYGSQWLWHLEKTKLAIDGRRPPDAETGDGYVLIRGG